MSTVVSTVVLAGCGGGERVQVVSAGDGMEGERERLDETVWANEVLAGEYEEAVVALWDSIRGAKDKLGALAAFEVESVVLPAVDGVESALDLGIEVEVFGEGETVDGAGWRAYVERYSAEGWKLVQSDWHHGRFVPGGGGVLARSEIDFNLHAIHPGTRTAAMVEWRHLESGGNSGVFVWASPASIKNLEAGKGRLPHGIEVQVLDLGYAEKYTKRHKKPADWFTSHGDVFPTGPAKMTPFPPVAPNGKRSFPSKETTLGTGEWNHYYVRAINGEVRLWVNGEEVSGGTGCEPATGYLCLESEGAPVEFRGLRIRKLP